MTDSMHSRKKKSPEKQKRSLNRNLQTLLIRLAAFAVLMVIMFGYVFGVTTNASVGMQPSFRQGDLLFFFRAEKSFATDDVVLIRYQGDLLPERVIAVAGDVVDITEKGLLVNGVKANEKNAAGETELLGTSVAFPLTVPEGQLFVLGDNRGSAADSRIFGCVEEKDVVGLVIGLFRRRGL